MKTFKLVQKYDPYTGNPLEDKERMWTGNYLCDYSGVELDADMDTESMPYIGINIVDLHDCEPYFHEERLRYTKEEAFELFDIDWDEDIVVDNYEIFHEHNPFVFENHEGSECFHHIIQAMLNDNSYDIGYYLVRARLAMIDKVLREKIYTPEEIGVTFD